VVTWEPTQELRELSMDLVMAAADDGLAGAEPVLTTIARGYGAPGVFYAMCLVADVALDALGMPEEVHPTALPLLPFCSSASAFSLNPAASWAGRFILGRAVMDREECERVFTEFRQCEPDDMRFRLMTLLNVAITAQDLSEVAAVSQDIYRAMDAQ
jgi:hypothetical protein